MYLRWIGFDLAAQAQDLEVHRAAIDFGLVPCRSASGWGSLLPALIAR